MSPRAGGGLYNYTEMKNNRRHIWITSKEVQQITERSPRYARRLLEAIRRKLNRDKLLPVSIAEFCQYMGLDEETVYRRLGY